MQIVTLVGGVGGAKLVDGLARRLEPESLTVVVNTADDFELYGLHISPDVDTVLYTLAGLANPETGWGIAGDTFHGLDMLARLGHETWFRLGDRDLATHLTRSYLLAEGVSLTEVTALLAGSLGVQARLLPMSDDPVATVLHTDEGLLDFQEYFVRQGWRPRVRDIQFAGIEQARPSPAVLQALDEAEAVILGPSNPFVSIGPIIAMPEVRDRLLERPVLAVTPIVGGQALKGPAAKMMVELGLPVSPLTVARQYRDFLNDFVLDRQDADLQPELEALGLRVLVADTVMTSTADRERLAGKILDWLGA